jgi:Na+/alanine symporter
MPPLGETHDLLARALALIVLTSGVLVALALLLVRRSTAAGPAPEPVAGPGDLAGAGFAGVVAGALAVALGGAGALAWLLVAALIGGALKVGEVHGLRAMSDPPGPIGQAFRGLHAAAAVVAALAAGALLHAQQAAEVARVAFPWTFAGLAAGLSLGTGLCLLWIAARPGSRALTGAGLTALGVWVVIALWFLAGDRAAAGAAIQDAARLAGTGEAALGGLLGVVAQGVLRAAVAGSAGGLGQAAPPAPWRGSMVAGFVALLTGLAVHAAGVTARAPVADRGLVALEPNLRTGLLPSEYGQMISVATDGPLAEGQRYPVVLRADPRGHRMGTLFRDENIVAVAVLDILRDVDTVILRDKDPERAKNPGFDLRIAVTKEVVQTPRGPFYKLAPVDPDINIRQLLIARDMDGPFLGAHDYPYVASVVRGFQMTTGERLSLFEEPRAKETPADPTIRDLVTLNYAGPYPDHGEPAPPQALVAPADSGLEPGTLAHLRLEAPPRGLDLGFINRLDELEVPPWQFLAACDTAVLRHKQDPALDREIRVTHRLAFGRLRFSSPDVSFATLAADFPDHTGPHLRPPAHRFSAEVHTGARLPPEHQANLALVPVHMHPAPTGNPGWGVYEPHPGEVLLTGMTGPYFDEAPAGSLVRAMARRWGPQPAGLAALCLLVLALAGLVAWARAGQRSAQRLFGPAVGPAFAVVFVVCIGLGPGLALVPVLRIADVAVAIAVSLGLAGLVARLPLRRT